MPFSSPYARNPEALLGSNSASTISCKLTIYNQNQLPYQSTDSLTVANGVVVGQSGNPSGASFLASNYSGGNVATACPSNFVTTAAIGGVIEAGAQGTGEVVALAQNASGLHELEPMVLVGGVVIVLVALALKGVEWARRIIGGVTEDDPEDYTEHHLTGYLLPNGRAATVVSTEFNSYTDVYAERVLGVWSLAVCEANGVSIAGTMDDMLVIGA